MDEIFKQHQKHRPCAPEAAALRSGIRTIGHDLLQIVTVGLGSPLGREVAPREVGAMLAGRLSDRAGLAPEFRRVMVACGAGAGLAAVYSVPLGGTLFVLEVLLGALSLPALIPAFATCVIATVVAWVGLGNESQYSLPALAISSPLVGALLIANANKSLGTDAPKVVYDVFFRLVPMYLAIAPPASAENTTRIDEEYTDICECDSGKPDDCGQMPCRKPMRPATLSGIDRNGQ